MARTKATFPGFPKEALQFLRSIEKNNNREWFEKKKTVYEESVKGPMLALVEAVGQEMLDYAPDYITEPKKAVFRIHRDVRFAKDKTPYKTNIAAGWHRQNLNKNDSASFYMHLSSKELFIGAGIYMPPPEPMKLMRNHIALHHAELREILADNQLRKWMGGLQGESMTRLPQGFFPPHPAEDLLKRKMYIVWAELNPDLAYGTTLLHEVSSRFAAATPLVEFLNKPLLSAPKPAKTYF
jgi:uncharacterized protein (TIGR02453 family)